jgi:hypothetical protein
MVDILKKIKDEIKIQDTNKKELLEEVDSFLEKFNNTYDRLKYEIELNHTKEIFNDAIEIGLTGERLLKVLIGTVDLDTLKIIRESVVGEFGLFDAGPDDFGLEI